jgi:opacity protein-like surface antigen
MAVSSEDDTAYMDSSMESYGDSRNRESAMLKIAWSMAFAAGDLNDFAGDASFRGFDIALLWPVVAGLHLGAGFGFNSLYEEHERGTYEVNTTAVTGKLYRYADAWSFSAVAQYMFLSPQSMLRPYAGLRVGIEAMALTTLVVDFAADDAPAGFLLAPDIGLQLNVSKQMMAYASYQFNFSTASTDQFDALSFSTVNIGIALKMGAM